MEEGRGNKNRKTLAQDVWIDGSLKLPLSRRKTSLSRTFLVSPPKETSRLYHECLQLNSSCLILTLAYPVQIISIFFWMNLGGCQTREEHKMHQRTRTWDLPNAGTKKAVTWEEAVGPSQPWSCRPERDHRTDRAVNTLTYFGLQKAGLKAIHML